MIEVFISKEKVEDMLPRDKYGDPDYDRALSIINQHHVSWCKENCTGWWEWKTLFKFTFELKEDATYFAIVWR